MHNIRYTDVTTLGRTIVGIDEFVKYNFAFFDAIPDWRYDPLPNQVYPDVTPEGPGRTVIRYMGSGHWTGPLRSYPYDESTPVIYGNGRFVQCPAVDRYHFNAEGLLEEGADPLRLPGRHPARRCTATRRQLAVPGTDGGLEAPCTAGAVREVAPL
ncbi:hypothetical protein [Nocardia vermiculata]|uniref:hypothetical protein n=1 Tax=Nocardia vermiculata TaxID=257274 RepID=UPI000ACA24CF|nr:hypothetical protein [Nocardia vermiculata]